MDATHRQLAHRVKTLRKEKGLSQEALARKIEIPRSALSQIETGERRVTTDELVRLSEALSTPPGVLLGTETEPEVCLARDAKPAVAESPMRINVPQRNLAKFKEVLLYMLGKVGSMPNVGETIIYKLLYFIDFDYYEKYEEQLIGATYIRNKSARRRSNSARWSSGWNAQGNWSESGARSTSTRRPSTCPVGRLTSPCSQRRNRL